MGTWHSEICTYFWLCAFAMGTTKAMGAVWMRVFVIASVALSDIQVSAGTPLLDLPGELIGDVNKPCGYELWNSAAFVEPI